MYENYLAAAFIHEPTPEDRRSGAPEIVLYNPTPQACEAALTVYYTDRDPATLPSVPVKAETNALLMLPQAAPGLLRHVGFVGFKVDSSTPLMVNLINGVRLSVPQPRYRGGCTNFHGTKLDREWRVPDGLWLEWNKRFDGDLSKAPFPFNELEHYHFLNPHPRDVEMEMIIQYRSKEPVTRHVTLKAERVWVWDNLGQVDWVHGYTVRALASEPIAVEAIRYIYGLTGLDEWGMTVHCAMYAIPGPVPG